MRILHCPVNIAGQAWEYAEAVREVGHHAEVWTFRPHPFGYPADRILSSGRSTKLGTLWDRARVVPEATQFDVIHYHFARTLLPWNLDARLFARLGPSALVSLWGSDTRLSDEFLALRPGGEAVVQGLQSPEVVRRRLSRLGHSVGTAAVADDELRRYASEFFSSVVRLPQVVHISCDEPELDSQPAVPRIVHAPSNRGIKGTEHVVASIEELRRQGRHLDFLLVENLSNAEARRLIATATVVVDQLLIGTYGILAIEAMMLGRPVVCYIADEFRHGYSEDLPIVPATPDSLTGVIAALLDDDSRRRCLASEGTSFAKRFHSREAVGRQLIDVYAGLQ